MRVILFEDNASVRDSLAILLGGMPDIDLVGVYPDPVKWEKYIRDTRPEVILMDIEMPGLNGIEATQAIHAAFPDINIIMLTVFKEEDKIFRALCTGAVGYILKNTTPNILIEAIHDTYAGGSPMSPYIARKAVQLFQQFAANKQAPSDTGTLTQREVETLKYLVEGLSYKMIAGRMGISYETVRSHMKHIYEKLHVASMTEAVVKALKEGLV